MKSSAVLCALLSCLAFSFSSPSAANDHQPSRGTIKPGTAAPQATGNVRWKTRLKDGGRADRFHFLVRNVPANATFTLFIDDTEVVTVDSTKKGRVGLNETIFGLTSVNRLRLVDATGVEVVRAEF